MGDITHPLQCSCWEATCKQTTGKGYSKFRTWGELLTQTNSKLLLLGHSRKNHDKCTVKNSHVCLRRKTNQERVYKLNCCNCLCKNTFKKSHSHRVNIDLDATSCCLCVNTVRAINSCALSVEKFETVQLVSSGYHFRECERKLNSSLLNFDLT